MILAGIIAAAVRAWLTTTTTGCLLLLTAASLGLTGCERGEPAAPVTPGPVAPHGSPDSAGPADTLRRLHQYRLAGEYGPLLALIVPEHRGAVRELILAVDQLTAAEEHLRKTIGQTIGQGTATYFQRRDQVANAIGPLSRDVEVLFESVSGNAATVTIQVAGQVPLDTVVFEKHEGAWLMVSDDPIPGLAAEIRKLAETTHGVALEVAGANLTAGDIIETLHARQKPTLRRMDALIREADRD
jgi:hypothetical protein